MGDQPRHIGLIGGIGPAATDFYYRRLIATFAARDAELTLTIVHADTPTLVRHLLANDAEAQSTIYVRLTDRLVKAGADVVAITSIAGHFCIATFRPVAQLPVIDMIATVGEAVAQTPVRRIGILGTRTVMANRFYGAISSADVIPPAGRELDDVHDAYVAMAASGIVTPEQRGVFIAAGRRLISDHGAEAIMLGGTDLALVFDAGHAPFPIIDCAGLHADAIATWAMPAISRR